MTAVLQGPHGAWLRAEAAARLGQHRLQTALATGELRALWPRVVVDGMRLLDVRTRAAAALLVCGPQAVISGPTAALLYGLSAADAPDTHVHVPYCHSTRSGRGMVVHRGRGYAADTVELDGLRVLRLERVVCDILCSDRPRTALAVTDQALAGQPAARRAHFRIEVQRRVEQRIDQRGTVQARRLLSLASGRAESPPESWLLLAIVDLGFPVPDANWSVRSPDGVEVYRLDLAWPDLRIAVEYDGHAVHSGRAAEDAARDEDLRLRGWLVVHVTVDDLRDTRRLEAALHEAFQCRGWHI